jgi:hypothetical protein
MIKKISVLLAFVALMFAQLALAQGSAVVASLVGTAQVQTGNATPRVLRLGDQVLQGDTISTGANSNVVLKFDDGEVTALTQNSRMTITAYQYEPTSRTGNMLLSLVRGGMRAVTGFLGRNNPERVAYRAATATIGIRGTDVSIVTDGTDTEVKVTDGSVTIKVGTQEITLTAGETAFIHNGAVSLVRPAGFPSWVGIVGELDTFTATLRTVGAQVEVTPGSGTGTVTITNIPGGGGGAGGGPPVSPH